VSGDVYRWVVSVMGVRLTWKVEGVTRVKQDISSWRRPIRTAVDRVTVT